MVPPIRPTALSLVVSYIIFTVMSIVIVILRFISIRILRRGIKVHDTLCVISLVAMIGYVIDTLIGTIEGGFGLHMDQVTMYQLIISMKTFFASMFFWETSISTFRLSTLLLYIEIFPQRNFRWWAYGNALFVMMFYIASIVTSLTICQPVNFSWNKTIPGKCGDMETAQLFAAAFNMVLDVVIVLLPLPIVWKLQMPMQRKTGIMVTFALGLSIAGINLARILKVLDCDLADFTYCTRDSAILTVAEMAVGVMVACTPTLGPIFFPRRRYGSTAQKQYHSKSGDTFGSALHIKLRSNQNDSFDVRSLNSLERDDIDLADRPHYGRTKSRAFAQSNNNKAANLMHTSAGSDGVRKVIEITTVSHAK